MKIKIADKHIGDDSPTFIIADVGSNHDGKLEQARELIDIARKAKVDAVKFQVFRGEHELPREWLPELAEYCKDIIFLATPADEEAVDLLEPLVPAYKVASVAVTNYALLKHIASKHKPMIISTGASTLGDVLNAVTVAYYSGCTQMALLHCTCVYPTESSQVNIRAMDELKRFRHPLIETHWPVGFSDHTLGIDASLVAVARGASVIEKHFTLPRHFTEEKSPDYHFSLMPDELEALVSDIRKVEEMLGLPVKTVLPEEAYMKELRNA